MTYSKRHAPAAAVLAMIIAHSTPAMAEDFTIKVGGRFQVDYAIADSDNAGLDVSASELRRARLKASGQYGDNLKYKFEVNTNSSEDVNITDAFLEFKPGGGKVKIKAGHFKTPNSLDEDTSSLSISTHERAAFTDTFALTRAVGIMASTSGDNYTFAAGVFGANLSDIDDQEVFQVAARGTYNPIKTEDTIVHLGASVRYRDQGGDDLIRYRQRPVTHIPGRILSTGSIADKDIFYGVEAAGIFQNFWVSGEYALTQANCGEGVCTDDPDLDGAYVEAGVVLGGRKGYKGKKFDRPTVDNPITKGGYGAVTFVGRYDTIDLSDGSIDGGSYDSVTLGADWWPTKRTRLGINYFHVDADLGSSTSGLDSAFATAVANPLITSDKVDGITARLQFDF